MTVYKHSPYSCLHHWTQSAPSIPAWVVQTPSSPKVCTQPIQPITPNPTIPNNATLQICTPIQLKKTGPDTVLITVSLPAESIITLPTKAHEIKMIRKNLKITESRYFYYATSIPEVPYDTPKLFIKGFVRKDIQYSEAIRQTATAVEGVIKDFVVDIPISCVIDLGGHLIFPPVNNDQQREYGFARSTPLPSGFSSEEQTLSSDNTEYNAFSQQYYNPLPTCQLLFSQINEIDNVLDRVPLQDSSFKEGVFRTLQEKMIILFQLRLTFSTQLDHPHTQHKPDKDCKHNDTKMD
ncbi:MAG: CsxC family protein [Desulfosporosinus sp.]|jgi:hypothetical protein